MDRAASRRIGISATPGGTEPLQGFIFSAISAGMLVRAPPSTSAFFVHSFSVCGVQPILDAIEVIAAHRERWSRSWPKTSRTGRERTSGENLFVVLIVIAPSFQELGLLANPVGQSLFCANTHAMIVSAIETEMDFHEEPSK